MAGTQPSPVHIICLASFFKGVEFLRECKRQGAHVGLVTKRQTLGENWPRESLDDIVAVTDDAATEVFTHVVSQLARPRKLHRLVALEEFDVINAAHIREHLQLPGMHTATARRFRDKLNMRRTARESGFLVPDFVHVLNHQEVGDFMERVPSPWMLKPRSDVSAAGIKKLQDAEQVWRAVDALDARDALQERSSYYLLEQYVPGDVFHVDSLVENGEVNFAGVSQYGRPPMEVAHGGGVFTSYTVEYDSADHVQLLAHNSKLLKSLDLKNGATHAEFIKCASDGRFYFLEVAARVGGAYIAETLEAASGVNLWRDWARLEVSHARGQSLGVPVTRREYGGIALTLARQERPDTSGYVDSEITYRVDKPHHVGLVVRSPHLERVRELLAQYVKRFATDFSAVAPPLERIGR